jgi:predicted nucleic acid-binding protein
LEKLDTRSEGHGGFEKKKVKLVDTSSWVHQMRSKGDPVVRVRVEQLLAVGLAAWCPIVRLELWAGVSREQERAALREYEQRIPELAISDEVWQNACELADRCRKAGKRAPANDLLILSCARYHGVELESADTHFDFLRTL